MDKGPFTKVDISVVNDTDGNLGRSRARNLVVENSDADWMFFLDADDRMHPNAFRVMNQFIDAIHTVDEIKYKNKIDAVWGNIWELAGGVCAWRYQVPRIRTYKQLIDHDPYLTLQMGHFVRREAFIPFDEDMNTGEDFKYYLQMWKERKCIKVEECLFLNQKGIHSSGPKSATGRDWNIAVWKLMGDAKDDFYSNADKK